MKLVSLIVGLLLVGLLVTSVEADISLKLRNKSYLPPPIQTIQEVQGNTQQQQQQQPFQESKYGNSKYHIFEVHNHFEPSAINGLNVQKPQVHNGNLPPQEKEIHIQHINAPAGFPFNAPNLDASYLSLASGSASKSQQIIVKHETRVTASNPSNNVPTQVASNYQQRFPQKSSSQPAPKYFPVEQNFKSSRKPIKSRQKLQSSAAQYHQQPQQVINNFKAPAYSTPHNSQQQFQQFSRQQTQTSFSGQRNQQTSQHFVPKSFNIKGKEYLPPVPNKSVTGRNPTQNVVQNSFNNKANSNFKGPDYLPPHQRGSVQQLQTSFEQNTPYKGPDYLPPHQQGPVQTQQANTQFKGPDYLPPHQQSRAQQQQINLKQNTRSQQQHTNFAQNNPFKGPEYLPPHQHGRSQPQQTNFAQNAPFKAPDYLPPHQEGSAQQQQTSFQQNTPFKGPDYLPPHQEGSAQQQQTSFQQNTPFKGPEYLPPHQEGSAQQQPTSFQQNTPFKGPDYLPPHDNQVQQQSQYQNANTNFKAPTSLPLGYDFQKPSNAEQAIAELHTIPQQSQQQYQQEVTVGTQIQVAGREQSDNIVYGSQKLANPPQSAISYQAPGYLPPGYDLPKPQNSNQAIEQLHSQGPQQQSQVSAPFKAINELHSHESSAPRQSQVTATFKASEYLPPGYDFQKPENSEEAINQLHSLNSDIQSTSSSASGVIAGPFNNAPVDSKQAINQLHSQSQHYQVQSKQNSYQTSQNHQQTQSYNQVPVQQQSHAQAQTYQTQGSQAQVSQPAKSYQSQGSQHQQSYSQQITNTFKGPDYLPPAASSPISRQPSGQTPPTTGTQTFKAPSALLQINQPLVHPFKGPDYLPPTTGSQTYKAPDYLPPVNAPQASSSPIYQDVVQQAPQQPQYKAPDYLPPTPATPTQPIQTTIMYPLSSYMTSVQPQDRYGNARKPFPEYGPPPTTAATFLANNDVSPMYREPATRPQYYAPAMSYTNNAVHTQTYNSHTQNQYHQSTSALNQQTRQTLQTFMPTDIRHEITAAHSKAPITAATTALQITKPASAKIRTVQIVNPTAVKTLKVLESLDQAGVKTIKILGPSHVEPMGDHHVVKVVSGNGQTEQTVKIFNDQQDVTTTNDQPQSNSNNGYLPPRSKRYTMISNARGRSRF